MQRQRSQESEQIDETLAKLLDAIASEPVPARIKTLAEQLRDALLVPSDRSPK